MNKMNWKWILAFAVALVGTAVLLGTLASAKPPQPPLPPPPPALPIQYRITWLHATRAGNYIDMNDSGEVVGNQLGGAFLYASAGLVDVDSLIASVVAPDDPSYGMSCFDAQGINNRGQIVGDGRLLNGINVGYLFTPVGFFDDGGNWVPPGVEFLPQPPGWYFLSPWRINDHGEVVATVIRDDRTVGVFVYDKTSSWIDTGASPPSNGSFLDFNNNTQVVGMHSPQTYEYHAFRWSPDGTAQRKLEVFSSSSWANGTNNAGQFVGGAVLDRAYRGFRYTDGEGMKSLGTLGQSSEAWGINDLGQVVGFYSVSTKNKGTVSTRHYGFFHTDASGMVPLDNLVTGSAEDLAEWFSAGIEPRRINTPRLPDGTLDPNGFGEICGTAHFPDGSSDAFLLTPEPSGM